MKRLTLWISLPALLHLFTASTLRAEEPLRVVSTTADLGALVRQIGGDQVVGLVVEGLGDDSQEALELGQDHRLGERRLGPDLVVDGLPAHPDLGRQPGHRDL